MSFILDALKKSEIERQRQQTPGLIETAAAPRRSRVAVWMIALGGLLAINFAVLLVVLMRGSATPAAPPPRAAQPAAATPAPASPEHFSPMDAPVYAPEIPVVQNATPAARPAAHAAPRPELPATATATADENPELLPLISEVDLGSLALPELHLDVHVYATKPAERFVYINMRKYHEGATLEEGPTIERIRRDGVVLNFHGVRFVLPRAVGQG
jgi:general secretion pathway protein B